MAATDDLTRLKFPIGPFVRREDISTKEVTSFIDTIEAAPNLYRDVAENLSKSDLNKKYREGSWTVHQLVNHVADMQMLHYFRMKKALTEPDYKEITMVDIHAWATGPEANYPVTDALAMMESITKRFVFLMRTLTQEQLNISYYHPVRKITLDQKQAISMTAWHVVHHLEHIKIALRS